MSYFGKNLPDVTLDAGGRLRVGQLNTLGDLKTLGADDLLLMENTVVGVGTAVWGDQGCLLSNVGVGGAAIRRSRQIYPYFSGKVTQVEMTQEGFQTQAGCVKRVGYFSSNAASPYDSNKDGFWVEDTGAGKFIKVSRNGTEVLSVAQASWNGDDITGYEWDKFTVLLFDFLWLGGAALRVMLKTPEGFKTLHTYSHAGFSANTMTLSPNHSVRWECRYSSGVGTLRAICAQVSTEGSFDNAGKRFAVDTGNANQTCASAGTTYALLGIRKQTGYRDRAVKALSFGGFIETANDYARFRLHRNPVLNVDLTWSNLTSTGVSVGVGNDPNTCIINAGANQGQVLGSLITATGVVSPGNLFENDFLSWLGSALDDTSDTLVVSCTPITASVDAYASLPFKEY